MFVISFNFTEHIATVYTPKVDTAGCTETLASIYQCTWYHVPENRNFQSEALRRKVGPKR
jgi:hypothetical protein